MYRPYTTSTICVPPFDTPCHETRSRPERLTTPTQRISPGHCWSAWRPSPPCLQPRSSPSLIRRPPRHRPARRGNRTACTHMLMATTCPSTRSSRVKRCNLTVSLHRLTARAFPMGPSRIRGTRAVLVMDMVVCEDMATSHRFTL